MIPCGRNSRQAGTRQTRQELPGGSDSPRAQAAQAAGSLGIAALSASISVGILKYRLYDIDRIISRTLAYAIVTGLLVGLYAGLVLLVSEVLGFHHSSVTVAGATLAACPCGSATATETGSVSIV